MPSSTAPEVKTATPIASVWVACTTGAVAVARASVAVETAGSAAIALSVASRRGLSGLRLEVAGEARDVLGAHDHGVHPGTLEVRRSPRSTGPGAPRSRAFPRGPAAVPARARAPRPLRLARGEQEDLRVEPVERERSSSSSATATTHSSPREQRPRADARPDRRRRPRGRRRRRRRHRLPLPPRSGPTSTGSAARSPRAAPPARPRRRGLPRPPPRRNAPPKRRPRRRGARSRRPRRWPG